MLKLGSWVLGLYLQQGNILPCGLISTLVQGAWQKGIVYIVAYTCQKVKKTGAIQAPAIKESPG